MKDKKKPPPSSFLHDSAFSGLDQEIDELPRVRIIKSAMKGSSSISNAYIINTGSRGGKGVLRGKKTPRRRSGFGCCEEESSSGGGGGGEAAAGLGGPSASSGIEEGGNDGGSSFSPPLVKSPRATKDGKKSSFFSPRPPLPGEASFTTAAFALTPSTIAGKVARRQRAAAVATLRALLDSAACGGGKTSPSSSSAAALVTTAAAAVPTFAVSCRECSRAVAGALRAAGVERFEVFSTGGGVAVEQALAAAVSAVVNGVRIKKESETEGDAENAAAADDDENDEKGGGGGDLGARLVLSVCHGACSHASGAVDSWVAAGGRHLEPPPPRSERDMSLRRSGGNNSSGDDEFGTFSYQNCGLSAFKAIGAALYAAWAFLVDKPPTEEERARARQKRYEKNAAEAARRDDGSTTSVLVGSEGGGVGGESGSRPASPSAPRTAAAASSSSPTAFTTDCCSKGLDSSARTRPLKHDVDGAPVTLQTAVDAFAVERAEEEWVSVRSTMAAGAVAALARRSPNSSASSPRTSIDVDPAPTFYEPALHEFAPPELSREARAIAVKNALRGVRVGGSERENGGDGSDASAPLAVAAAVAEEGARLSAAALLKAVCRALGGPMAASVVLAALRLEGEVREGDGDESEGDGDDKTNQGSAAAAAAAVVSDSTAAVESFEKDLEGSGRGGGRRLLARVLAGGGGSGGRGLAVAGCGESGENRTAGSSREKEEETQSCPRSPPPPPLPRSFSVLRRGWCEVHGARRCYYFES